MMVIKLFGIIIKRARLSNPKDQISHLHIHLHKVCELGYDSFAVRCVMRLVNQTLEAEMGPNTETSDYQC
jgi:hypothetical protein